MSKLLSELIGARPADVAGSILEFEKLSGHPSLDVKLALEIEKVSTSQARSLGLDQSDTRAAELYHSLLSRFEQDNHRFTRAISGRSSHGHAELAPRVIKALEGVKFGRMTYALKRSAAKDILLACPPKKTMKLLGYRSMDSLIKREPVEEIFACAAYGESESYSKQLQKYYAKLTPANFERREVSFNLIKPGRWESINPNGSLVGFAPLLGSVAVWPIDLPATCALALAVLILKASQNARVIGASLEYAQASPNFGRSAATLAVGNEPVATRLGSQIIPWRTIARKFGAASSGPLPELLTERISPEEIAYSPVEAILCQIDPGLRWWLGLDFIGKSYGGKVVSFNLGDVAINFANKRTLAKSTRSWLSLAIFDELAGRYLDNPWVADVVLGELSAMEGSL